jgi:hypothetical protein
MVKTIINYRISYALIVFVVGIVFNITLYNLFLITAIAEIVMIAVLSEHLINNKLVKAKSIYGFLILQYANGSEIDMVQMIHMGGGRILACLLGSFAVLFYIPTILIYLSTCFDIVKKKSR